MTKVVGVVLFCMLVFMLAVELGFTPEEDPITFDQAIIRLDGDVYYDVDIQSWRKVNSSEVEVIGTNGTVYRTHCSNVILLGGDGLNESTEVGTNENTD